MRLDDRFVINVNAEDREVYCEDSDNSMSKGEYVGYCEDTSGQMIGDVIIRFNGTEEGLYDVVSQYCGDEDLETVKEFVRGKEFVEVSEFNDYAILRMSVKLRDAWERIREIETKWEADLRIVTERHNKGLTEEQKLRFWAYVSDFCFSGRYGIGSYYSDYVMLNTSDGHVCDDEDWYYGYEADVLKVLEDAGIEVVS